MFFFLRVCAWLSVNVGGGTPSAARADVFDYIERFYNPRRRHSTLAYLSPMEYEKQATLV